MLKKFNKSSPKILLTHTPKFFYESIWIRFFKYFKKSNINSNSVYHDDLNKSSSLSEQLPFQYKMDETKPKTITPMIVLEAQLRTIEEQKEISEIESLRMKEIDKMLGTNTYFHEVQDNEERLSSEFVMERKALKDFAEQESFTDVLVNIDPQQRLSMPKIRNFNDFAKKAFEMSKFNCFNSKLIR